MTQTQAAPADPHKRYKDITDLVLKTGPERAATLQDRILFAWADHVRKPENKDDHGKGLGDAMYGAASNYVKTEFYGLTGDLPGNEDFKTEVDGIIATTLGIDKPSLNAALKDKKNVHAGELDELVELTTKAMQKKIGQIQIGRLKALPETDLDAFKAYMKEEADAMKVEFDPAKAPTMDAAIKAYLGMVPLIAQYRGLGERAKAYKQSVVAEA